MAATSRASPNRDRSTDTDGGMVTIEAAVALCAFVTVLAMVLAGVSMVLDQIRCVDAAREAARLVARGEQNRAADAVRRIGPPRATLSITTNGDEITVVVQDPAGGSMLPGVHVRGEAYAIQEPTDPDPTAAAPVNPSDGSRRRIPAQDRPAGSPHEEGSGRSSRSTEGGRR
jgi:Flp pilus assembly protein TadG